MIYTLTLNPSLDYLVHVNDFGKGIVNRTGKEQIVPGGKGINVSMVLKNLGMESISLGYLAGFTGEEICRLLQEYELQEQFIRLPEGMSRINVKIFSSEETEVNGMGPYISEENIGQLYDILDTFQDGDMLVLAGSIPMGVPSSLYADIMKYIKQKKIAVVVDSTRDVLEQALVCQPFLVKPNHVELGDLFGVSIETQEEAVVYGRKLQEKGAVNVLVSMGGKGAVFLCEDGSVYKRKAPKGKVINSVGAGDSMIAGFLTGYIRTGSYERAFHMGVAAGSASAFSEKLATKKEIETIMAHEYTL